MSILPDIDDAAEAERPKVSQDVADAIELLLWARDKGFRLPEIHIGTVHIKVSDLRQHRREGGGEARQPTDIYSEYGGIDKDEP